MTGRSRRSQERDPPRVATSLASREWPTCPCRCPSWPPEELGRGLRGRLARAERRPRDRPAARPLVPLLFNSFLHGITLTAKGDYEAALSLFLEGMSFAENVGRRGDPPPSPELPRVAACGAGGSRGRDRPQPPERRGRPAAERPGDVPERPDQPRGDAPREGRAGPGQGVPRERTGTARIRARASGCGGGTRCGCSRAWARSGWRGATRSGRRSSRPEPGGRDAHELAEEPGERVAAPGTDRPGSPTRSTRPRRPSARPSPSPRRSATRRSSGRRTRRWEGSMRPGRHDRPAAGVPGRARGDRARRGHLEGPGSSHEPGAGPRRPTAVRLGGARVDASLRMASPLSLRPSARPESGIIPRMRRTRRMSPRISMSSTSSRRRARTCSPGAATPASRSWYHGSAFHRVAG